MLNKTYKNKDYTIEKLPIGEYEECVFISCNFSNSDLSGRDFMDCRFENCDLSSAKLGGTSLKTIDFDNCKMLGLNFEDCTPFLFKINFESCQLNFSTFYKLKLKGIKFIDCKLQEVDFTEANLSNSKFVSCDLNLAIFDRTNLEKADFYSAINFNINPNENRMKGAIFSKQNLEGLVINFGVKVN